MRILTNLGAAIALRLMDKSRRGLDAKESKFLLKKPGHKLRAMVMAKGQPFGDVFAKFAKTFPNPPADWFKGFKAGSAFGGMDSHTFHGAMIHGKENGDLSLIGGQTRGLINPPHLIDSLGDDLAIMRFSPDRVFDAARGKQIVLLHEPQTLLGEVRVPLTESGPHL